MGDERKRRSKVAELLDSRFFDGLRRREGAPGLPPAGPDRPARGAEADPPPGPGAGAGEPAAPGLLIAEVATCLWYLKTKHFKRDWDDAETGDDDPRVRRALGRINRSIDALRKSRIEVHDPTGRRYPRGGEAMMRPVQFLPTAGVDCETVTETVLPVIFSGNRLLQRGEVFVAVPKDEPAPGTTAGEPRTPGAPTGPAPPEDPPDREGKGPEARPVPDGSTKT